MIDRNKAKSINKRNTSSKKQEQKLISAIQKKPKKKKPITLPAFNKPGKSAVKPINLPKPRY